MSVEMVKAQPVDIHRAPANPREAVATLRDLLEKQKNEIAKVLPKHLSSERLARIAVSAVSRDKKLMECTPISVLRSVMQAAMLGFEPGGPLGDSYLVPYFNKKEGVQECQLIPGYKGLISLSRRSGQILSIEADVVREKDVWSFRKNQDGTFFEHGPSEEAQPGEILRAYAVARLKDTPLPVIIVMPKRDVDSIMHSTQSRGGWGPWKDHYSEMAKKTAIRRLMKYLPMSVEFADALDREDRVEKGEPVDGDFVDFSVSTEPGGQDAQKVSAMPGGEQPQLPAQQKRQASALDALVKPVKVKAAKKEEVTAPATPLALKRACEECKLLGVHAQNCSKWEPPISSDPAPEISKPRTAATVESRIRLSDGTYYDPETGEVPTGDGREPGSDG